MDDTSWDELINLIKDPFHVALNNIFFNNHSTLLQNLNKNIKKKKNYYYFKIIFNNHYEIPMFRNKKTLIDYIHFKLRINS